MANEIQSLGLFKWLPVMRREVHGQFGNNRKWLEQKNKKMTNANNHEPQCIIVHYLRAMLFNCLW